jgi:hypothetical protein
MYLLNYWFCVPCPSSGILYNRKQKVSETGSVSVPRCGGRHLFSWLRLALSKGPNSLGVSFPSTGDGERSSFRNFVFASIFRNPDDGQSPESQYFWVLYTIVTTLQILYIVHYSPLKYPIVYLTWRWPVGAETCSEKEENKNELTYWNFVAINGIIRNQLYLVERWTYLSHFPILYRLA